MGQLYSVLTRCIALCVIFLSLSLMGFANQGKIKVTLEVTNKRRADVLHLLEKQTGMIFFYASNLFDREQKISVSAVNQSLDEVLMKVFEGTGMGWNYEREKYISIKPVKKVVTNNASAGDSSITSITVSGKVTSADDTPIPGATVILKGATVGDITNEKGFFSLQAKKNDLLVISSLGYETMELKVTGTSILVKLQLALRKIDETVVIGYGTSTKRFLTGSVSRVSGETINQQPIPDPIVALQGRVPGLYITQSSGVPGSNITVRLRGRNSIRQEANNPLYIIDGVPYPSTSLTNPEIGGGAAFLSPFNMINSAEIESIEVLKDADATSIYGSRGANGVILITTKKGKQGKTTVSFNLYTGTGKVTNKLNLLNTKQYLKMRHEAFLNDGTTPRINDYDINGKWDTTRYTDWQNVFIGGTSNVYDAQMSITGGTENTQFIIGGRYREETTVYPGQYQNNKGSVNINLNHTSLNKRFRSNIAASFLKDNNTLPTTDFTSLTRLAPNAPAIYDNMGNLNWENNTWNNPFAALMQQSKSTSGNLLSNGALSYSIFPNLEFKVTMGYNNVEMDQSLKVPITASNPSFGDQSSLRSNSIANSKLETWIIEPQANYNTSILKGTLNVLVGMSLQDNTQTSISQYAFDFPNDALMDNIAAAASVITLGNSYTKYRYSAFFGRLNYNLYNKYLVTLTGRRDGSSRFGSDRQFGNFGSIGLGWIFSNERLIERNIPFISFGKIRVSYGTTGNDQLPDYGYLSTYTSYSVPYLGAVGLYPTRLSNPDFSWEIVKKFEAGIDFGFLKDRIMVSSSVYRNRTSSQLIGYPVPAITGFTSVQYNLPALLQNSGIEVEINSINVKSSQFSWSSSLNVSFPRNKLLKYPNIEGSAYANTYKIGQSLSIQNKYHSLGVDPKTGVYYFEDVDHDGRVSTPNDLRALKKSTQEFFGGLQNSVSFKNFRIDVFFQFVKQTGRVYSIGIGRPGSVNANQMEIVMNRWQNVGDNTSIQKFTQSSGTDGGRAYTSANNTSDLTIGDASFIRLKNVSLSYSLPEHWRKVLRLQNSRIYLQCQNLLTFTNYVGLDPETLSINSLPPIKMITAGLQLDF